MSTPDAYARAEAAARVRWADPDIRTVVWAWSADTPGRVVELLRDGRLDGAMGAQIRAMCELARDMQAAGLSWRDLAPDDAGTDAPDAA